MNSEPCFVVYHQQTNGDSNYSYVVKCPKSVVKDYIFHIMGMVTICVFGNFHEVE